MSAYLCSLNTGDTELDAVVMRIEAASRGQAKQALLAAADDAGFEVDWTTHCSIRLERSKVEREDGAK